MTYQYDFQDISDEINNIALMGSEEDWINSDNKEEIEEKLNSVINDLILQPYAIMNLEEELNSYLEDDIEGSTFEEVRDRILDELGDIQEGHEIEDWDITKQVVIESIYYWMVQDVKDTLDSLIKESLKIRRGY